MKTRTRFRISRGEMSWKLGDTELVIRKAGASVSMRWDYRREFELDGNAATGEYTLSIYREPAAFEGIEKVSIEERDAERMRRGVIGPLPNQSVIEPGSSLVISQGTRGGEFHLVPVQLDRLPHSEKGFMTLPPVDVRDLDSWVGRQVHVVRRLQSFRGRLLAATPELVLACPTANGKEKITRLRDYESISTAQDSDFGQHCDLKPGEEGKVPQGQIRLALVHPATHLHVHFGLLPNAMRWAASYTAILSEGLKKVRLFRAQADVFNRTGFEFRAVPQLTLKAEPEPAPVRRSAPRRTMMMMSMSAPAPESASPSSAGDLAGQLATTYELPLPGGVLPPSRFRPDGREIPMSALLFSDRKGVGVDPFFLLALDMWSPTTAADAETSLPTELNLRFTNRTERAWVAGPIRIFASEDFRNVQFVGASRLSDTKSAGGTALVALTRSALISYRPNIQVTTEEHLTAPISAGAGSTIAMAGSTTTMVGSTTLDAAARAGGGARRSKPARGGAQGQRRRPAKRAGQWTPSIGDATPPPPAPDAPAVQPAPVTNVEAEATVSSPVEEGSVGTEIVATVAPVSTKASRAMARAPEARWMRRRTSVIDLTLENAQDQESLPLEVQGELEAEFAIDFPAPPSLTPLLEDGTPDPTQDTVELSRASVGRKGRTIIVRVPPLPPKSKTSLRFAVAYDRPVPSPRSN